jgi:hypothetical protein
MQKVAEKFSAIVNPENPLKFEYEKESEGQKEETTEPKQPPLPSPPPPSTTTRYLLLFHSYTS